MIKRKELYSPWYHGTDLSSASRIMGGGINVKLGGGELGQGFYMGSFKHEAKHWAFRKNMNRHKPKSVVEFKFTPYISFAYEHIGRFRGLEIYEYIVNSRTTRTHILGKDLFYCQVLGVKKYGFYQLKWESLVGQSFLNSSVASKSLI